MTTIPDVKPLWAHQREIAARAAGRNDGFGLFMEMGTGKTATSIQTVRLKCYTAKRQLRTLVLCPPAMRQTWAREFATWSKLKRVHVLDGSGKKRAEALADAAFDEGGGALGCVAITNYESLLMPELFELLQAWCPEIIIFDESQRVKDRGAKRTKAAIQLADEASFTLLLSGTPILNSAMDVWAQFRILDGGETFDQNFFAFRARWFEDRNAGMPRHKYFPDWRPREGIAEAFNSLIYRKAARVLKKDCLDLPPLVKERVMVELAPEQQRMYDAMKKDFIAYMGDKACVASIALTKGLRLQQIVSGFFVDDEGGEHTFKTNPRLEKLGELLAEIAPEHKVIVWSSFRHSYGPIGKLCDELALPYVTLYGGMTDKARQAAIDDFQTDPKVRVMVANAAAGGVGVTLTAASYAIYAARTWNLEHDMQSEARCHRGGSEVHARITRIDLVAPDTIDEVILDALSRKENLANNILRMRELL